MKIIETSTKKCSDIFKLFLLMLFSVGIFHTSINAQLLANKKSKTALVTTIDSILNKAISCRLASSPKKTLFNLPVLS